MQNDPAPRIARNPKMAHGIRSGESPRFGEESSDLLIKYANNSAAKKLEKMPTYIQSFTNGPLGQLANISS